ncbi:unnamed protein product [Paramecium pentaurelia]|uniref:Uncharacterized protein n=1 Tax=Paramecium pentaurelia TaxID=43138 RepID=A0A8S1SG69_9CILI|nr:unnamed protein product [Paramecium pentaurelia]
MSINNVSWEQVENPSKTKFKQLYLNKYRIKLGLFSNHKEQLPISRPKHRNISIKELDHLIKPEMIKAKIMPDNQNQKVLTAQLLNKITQKQLEQEYFCQFPEITQTKKKRSKTEHHNNQYSKLQKSFARTAYLIVI